MTEEQLRKAFEAALVAYMNYCRATIEEKEWEVEVLRRRLGEAAREINALKGRLRTGGAVDGANLLPS